MAHSGRKDARSREPEASFEARFARALVEPDAPPPETLRGPRDTPAGKRFDVYRNNVAVSLTEALETGFPVLRRLLGPEFFAAMAGVFLRRHPPETPVMMDYGAAMPGFLADFPPVAHLPYLPDVARLELALRRAYHAADAAPLAPDALARREPDELDTTVLVFAPAVQLIRSPYPVHGIWRANTEPGAPAPSPGGEAVLVTRPAYDPVVDALALSDGALVAALMAGRPLGAAAPPGADLAATLRLLLTRSALTEFSP